MDLPRLFRLGLGTDAFARVGRVGSPDAVSPGGERIAGFLRFGVEHLAGPDGLAHLDTSSEYGNAERLLGRCFDHHPALRSRLHVATGWGLRFHPTQSGVEDYSFANLRRSVEESAGHLRGFDLLYLRTNPGLDPGRLRWLLRGGDGCIERMHDLRKRRVHGIRQIGVSLSSRESLELVVRSPDLLTGFDVLQLSASLATEHLDLAARLQSLGISLISRSPWREGDSSLCQTADGVRSLYQEVLGALPEALLLGGPADLALLGQSLEHVTNCAALRPLALAYASEPTPAAEAREIEEALLGQLAAYTPEPAVTIGEPKADFAATAEHIARVLIGTRKTRLGRAPAGPTLVGLHRRIADHVRLGLPVDVILTWGPRKFHASRDENRPDVAELMAFARLCAFQAEVRRIHPPGLRYTLFYEDLEGAFIEGEDDAAFWPYGAGLVRLVNVLGLASNLRVVGTRGLLRRFDPAEVDARLAENYAHLRAHWHGAGDAAALERLGFSGGIDPESRRFYLERLDRLLGERRTREEKRDMVIRLFAAVLLHRQLDMFRVRPELEPVKLSFLALAGGPASLAEGRVDVRSISADLCKHSLAPWSAKGYLRRKHGAIQPASKPWPQPFPAGARLRPGELRLRRGEASFGLRADWLDAGL